jgi:hypothetical protein
VAEVTGVLKTSEVQYCFSMEILNSIHEIGSRTEYFKDGKIKFQGQIKDGKLNGYSREFSSDGKLMWIGFYEDSLRIYPHEKHNNFNDTEFTIKPALPDTVSISHDTIYFKIISPYHFDDFTTFASTAYHLAYRNKNLYSIKPIDTVGIGYVRIGVAKNSDFSEWKFIDSVYIKE